MHTWRCARDVSPQTELCGRCPLPRVEEKPSSTFLFPPGTPENPSPQHVPARPPSHCGQESLLGISCPGRHLVFCTIPRVLPLALTTSKVLGYTSKGAETRWHQHRKAQEGSPASTSPGGAVGGARPDRHPTRTPCGARQENARGAGRTRWRPAGDRWGCDLQHPPAVQVHEKRRVKLISCHPLLKRKTEVSPFSKELTLKATQRKVKLPTPTAPSTGLAPSR